MKQHNIHLNLLILPLLTLTSASIMEKYIITVEPYEEECYFEKTAPNKMIFTSYEVTEGGFTDIDFTLTFSNGTTIEAPKSKANFYFFKTLNDDQQTIKICFNNKFSSLTPKVIYILFSMIDFDKYQKDLKQSELDDQNMTSDNMVKDLLVKLEQFDAQNYASIARQMTHFQINERTNLWILLWAIFEALMLIALTIGQVYYIKKFFEVKRYI